MKRFVSLLIVFAIVCSLFVPGMASAASPKISVYIDGEAIEFNVQPEIINGKTMVPMRKIFEHLGADVTWYDADKSILAVCGYLNVRMKINNNEMKVNNSPVKLSVAPLIKNGKTLVPLRAVAEAFSAEVEWVDATKTVIIKTKYPKKNYVADTGFDAKHIRTASGNYEYIDFAINGNILTISGHFSDKEIEEVGVNFDNSSLQGVTTVSSNGDYKCVIDLSGRNISDKTNLSIYTRKSQDVTFWSYVYNCLYIEKNGNDYRFQKPLVLENNKALMSKWINPIGYLKKDISSELVKLSDEICKDALSDYEKIVKIHDWVADNIYYDYDYYYNRQNGLTYTASDVYTSRRTVCEGYSNITQALIQAQNIPCRKISGYSLGLSAATEYWTEEAAATATSNHAWVQAYVDNRWVNIDATWNSGNKYENGQFLYKGIENHLYFDISTAFFAYNHKYLRIG